MKVRRAGRLTLGTLLVAYGLILMLSKILKFSAAAFISKWWPLTFIMLGLEILLAGTLKKDEAQTKVSIDGWSIFFIIIIILVSCGIDIGYKVTRNNPFNFRIDGSNFNNGFFNNNYKYESVFEKEFKVDSSGKEKIIVSNEFGNVRVNKGEGKDINIKANIKIRNNDEEYAKKISDSVVKITKSNPFKVESNIQNYLEDRTKINGININYTITVPEGIEVEVNNKYGNVSVADISKNTSIECAHGDVDVDSIKGNLIVKNQYANISIVNVSGEVKASNRNGKIDVKDAGSIKIGNEYADIIAKNIKGDAEIINKNGSITLTDVSGKAVINTKYSEVEVMNIAGSLKLNDNNGNVLIKDVGKEIIVENKYANIDISNPKDSVSIKDKNGNISLESNEALKGNIDIENEYGNIEFKVPKNQEGNFKIYTKYGNIDSSLNLNIKKDDNEESIEQKLGDGNAVINLRDRNGNISIK